MEPVKNRMNIGGGGRNRTGVHGFAGRCITTLPPRLTTAYGDRIATLAPLQCENKKQKGKTDIFSLGPSSQIGQGLQQ